jgi:ABC-type transport system involved in multi-copper enzyme maturation permease subunit
MRSLLWKEWHEQRWKLAFSSLLLAGFTFFGLHARVVSDAAVLIASSSLAIVLLPLLVGAVMVAPERETGTLQTLMALPANPLSILGAKTVVGLVACIVPILVTCLVALIVSAGREMLASTIVSVFATSLFTTLSLFFWMFSTTMRSPGETRSTLLALGVLIGWMMITLGLAELYRSNPSLAEGLGIIDPFYFFGISTELKLTMVPQAIIAQTVVAGLLWFWAARQFLAEEARS